MSKTFVTNTHIAPIVDVSTYEGPFSYESLWQPDEESEREEGRIVCWDYDSEKMGERIVEEANRVFEAEKPLAEYGVVEIKATKFGSPREYNFTSDWLDLEVEVDAQFFTLARQAILKKANRKAIVEYAGNHWVSYDGFSSAMLNHICTLSRDTWKHKQYGTHMATDDEVEKALVADLCEAFEHLENGTGDDEFREFGAILALLWLIEYPGDFDRRLSESWSGSWVADEMVEHLRGNSSISEFCTVLDKDEIRERFGAHMVDFDERRKAFAEEIGRYAVANFPDKARVKKICAAFEKKVGKVFDELEAEQTRVIANHATDDKANDASVNDRLDDFREEAEPEMTATAFIPLWAEASHEAM